MSQRQVNLKGGNIGEAAVGAVDILTKSMQGVAKQQLARREQSEKAILIGNQTAEALIDKYSEQTKSTDVMVQTGLTNAIREQAMKIGKAKYLASKPGATQEDRDNYLNLKSQGQVNLDALAKWSVNTEENKNAYKLHQQAVENGTNLNRLSRDVLTNDPDLIEFENLLTSGTASDVKIDFSSGKPTFTVFDANGKGITRNIYDDNQAFSQTGNTIRGQAISKEELLDGEVFKSWRTELEEFDDLKPVPRQEKRYDPKSRTETTVKVLQAKNPGDIMYNDRKDWLLSKTKNNFGKNWDQLNGLNLLEESELKDISWGTLNNSDYKAGTEKLNAQYAKIKSIDPTPTDNKITEDDYLRLQGQMRDDAAKGLSKFINIQMGQPVETVIAEAEIVNKYRGTDSNGKAIALIKKINKDKTNKYDPISSLLGFTSNAGGPNGFNGLMANLNKPSVLASIPDLDAKNEKLFTSQELRSIYKSKGLDIPSELEEDNVIFQADKNNVNQEDYIGGGFEYWGGGSDGTTLDFVNGILDENSKRNLYRLFGVEFDLYDDVQTYAPDNKAQI